MEYFGCIFVFLSEKMKISFNRIWMLENKEICIEYIFAKWMRVIYFQNLYVIHSFKQN